MRRHGANRSWKSNNFSHSIDEKALHKTVKNTRKNKVTQNERAGEQVDKQAPNEFFLLFARFWLD